MEGRRKEGKKGDREGGRLGERCGEKKEKKEEEEKETTKHTPGTSGTSFLHSRSIFQSSITSQKDTQSVNPALDGSIHNDGDLRSSSYP